VSFYLEVEIPAYCEVPHNKIVCPFLKKKHLGKNICTIYKKPVNKAVSPWKSITLPCEECEENRQNNPSKPKEEKNG